MRPETYQKTATELKIVAVVVGLIAIIYGLFVGVLGLGPDGPGVPLHWRVLGIGVLVLGGLYLLPNKKLTRHRRLALGYVGMNLLPTIALGIAVYITISKSGIASFIEDGGLLTVSVLVPLSLLAPLSLIFSILGARVSSPQEPLSFSGTVGSSTGNQSPERSDGTTVQSHKS